MGFIHDYFKKPSNEITRDDVLEFISQNNEESLNLEYKSAETINDVQKLTKTISSFSNSAGGLFILGVSEVEIEKHRHPGDITWIKDFTKERLENIIVSNIQPQVLLTIVPVVNPENRNEQIFLLDIPASDNPPHISKNKKYYKRLNFQAHEMEHYEIADYFGKRKLPKLELRHSFVQGPIIGGREFRYFIHLSIYNVGKSMAKYPYFSLSFNTPAYFKSVHDIHTNNMTKRSGDNAIATYNGDVNCVVHVGAKIDVCSLEIKLSMPPRLLENYPNIKIRYQMGCEDLPIFSDEHDISGREICEL